MSARIEIDTGMEGFRFWPGALSASEQAGLLAEVLAAEAEAPFYRPVTPGGRPFSVQMTSLGPLGWVSDRAGYRYQATHPVTGKAWPPIPPLLLDLWRGLTRAEPPPDACLVNLYRDGARMGLHQDRDEADMSAPVLSVSLGDAAMFRIGAAGRGPTKSIRLTSGDVCALTGPARLARHGIDRVIAGSSGLVPGGGRINLTLRRAA
ncbi:alpha-ketoglutarate-dependent dioxygenase AlkB [Brevundimonas sp.]|uniref:alpha-ketoglutarate-dependent dioxygenase AlkB n=1 Tax=Brevundimonas sp. TaxID=1871086 RepID=UPI002C0E9EFD|nr:alpha-ketoglutarate-dependent dioxygenase AlkB [Brevundimonas sp.]HWQ85457.1 alpha-ketoglutarate-dependent dioxygenase AlkB [Brevundimonas sp.]